MSGRLAGKVAVITGAAAGMGKATSELFVKEGAKVILADYQFEKAQGIAAALGGSAKAVPCNVLNDADVDNAVAEAEKTFGGLDIMFNNAGAASDAGVVEAMSNDEWDRNLALLLRSVFFGIRAAAPAMRRRGGGAIVNTASAAGIRAGYGNAAYGAAKAAVLHLSKSAANELAHADIRVNAIVPGFIATSIFGSLFGADPDLSDKIALQLDEHFSKFQMLPRAGQPSDIAEACLYLASDASRFVTGAELLVDGGLYLQGPPQTELREGAPMTAMLKDIAAQVAKG